MNDCDIDLEGNGDGYSGTFRWRATKTLRNMPSIANNLLCVDLNGWGTYFRSRCNSDVEFNNLVTTIKSDLSYIDCLSMPLSIGHILKENLQPDIQKPLIILCIGCSNKAEERVLMETNCWEELGYLLENDFTSLELWLIGPEISHSQKCSKSMTVRNPPFQFTSNIFKGTCSDFFRENPSYLVANTVVFGLNCGFGNFENPLPRRYELCFEWLPDLYFLTATRLPVFFTCANDYADLAGEVAIMRNVMGAHFIAVPSENPYSYASTYLPPGSTRGNDYSRGNAFWYGVQHFDKKLRRFVDTRSPNAVYELMDLLKSPVSLDPETIKPIVIKWKASPVSRTPASISSVALPSMSEIDSQIKEAAPKEDIAPEITSIATLPTNTSEATDISLSALANITVSSTSSSSSFSSSSTINFLDDQLSISQAISDNNLTVLVTLPVAVTSITAINLSISRTGRQLLLSRNCTQDSTSSDNASASDRGSSNSSSVTVDLLREVQSDTMTAKFQRKTRVLTIVALVQAN